MGSRGVGHAQTGARAAEIHNHCVAQIKLQDTHIFSIFLSQKPPRQRDTRQTKEPYIEKKRSTRRGSSKTNSEGYWTLLHKTQTFSFKRNLTMSAVIERILKR